MTPGEQERADAMDVRCLDLCIGMLERVNGARISILFFHPFLNNTVVDF